LERWLISFITFPHPRSQQGRREEPERGEGGGKGEGGEGSGACAPVSHPNFNYLPQRKVRERENQKKKKEGSYPISPKKRGSKRGEGGNEGLYVFFILGHQRGKARRGGKKRGGRGGHDSYQSLHLSQSQKKGGGGSEKGEVLSSIPLIEKDLGRRGEKRNILQHTSSAPFRKEGEGGRKWCITAFLRHRERRGGEGGGGRGKRGGR